MEARANADLRLTSTTISRIDDLIDEAARLGSEYRVPTGFQRGPFFEIQTDRFALVAIDTGIVKRIDDLQWAWLEGALARAKGKLTMAILGHPFYAAGFDQTGGYDDFARLKRLLLQHGVAIVMAGDTHDLEYLRRTGAQPPGLARRCRPSFCQRRGRGVSQLRDGVAVAGSSGHGGVGTLPRQANSDRQDRGANTQVEMAGLVVDLTVQRLAVFRRMALGHLRLQRGAVFPELHRSARRAVGSSRAAAAVRRVRSTSVEGRGAFGEARRPKRR